MEQSIQGKKLLGIPEKFNKKYILRVARNKIVREFQELKQGQMIVSQCEVKFTQLSRYARKQVFEEEERTRRFVRGLKSEILKQIDSISATNLSRAVEKTPDVEWDMQKSQEIRVKEKPPTKCF